MRGTGWAREDGSAVAEFTFVAMLLTALTLSVLQLGLALHVRNTVIDAAAEGARFAALADNGPADGVARTKELITVAIGAEYADDVTAETGTFLGHPSVDIRVVTRLPLLGLIGVEHTLEVQGHAAVETLDD
ncbi:TadE family protein [Mycetocola sp. 2940]|uniref:TadE family protein n=1 Tax=Mycetocola sp. 2940 TaxID=3156452 RepID=UPI0033986A20